MGWYGEVVLPRVLDVVMDTKQNRPVRARVCAGLAGEVVELGSGSGHNLRFLPSSVTRLWAVEPSARSQQRAEGRAATQGVSLARAGTDARRLELDDASVDAVLTTWTLCTIPEPEVALAEARRVLRPGGRLHFVEHGLSPDPAVARWQHRLDGLQQRVAGGCHLVRPIDHLVSRSGFTIEQMETYTMPGEPRPWAHTFEGTAIPT